MDVSIGFDNFEILKIDDRDFTVEINAYLIVKWKDSRIIIDFAHVSFNKYIIGITIQCKNLWLFCKKIKINENEMWKKPIVLNIKKEKRAF